MDPLTWTYLALLAASTAASAQAQHKTSQARARVQAEDTDRRKKQQQESEAAALRTQESFLNQRGKTAEREAELAAQFQPAPAAAPTTDTAGTRFLDTAAPTQSTATIEASTREGEKGRARATQRATSMAQLGAFAEALRENKLGAARNAQDIGISANAMQGWQQNVLPALYAKANTAGKDWQTGADIAKLVAAVMAPAALGGGGAAAEGVPEVTAGQISTARFGDFATGFGGGGAIPFGSSLGVDAGAALTSAGTASSLVGSEGLSNALWRQINGYPLTDRERQALLMKQMAGGM